jgi:hypothetical protein
MLALQREPWTGNVRELENCVQRALVLAPGDRLDVGDFALSQRDHSASRIHFASCDYCLQDVEQAYIERVLEHTDGNQSLAARIRASSRPGAKRHSFASVDRTRCGRCQPPAWTATGPRPRRDAWPGSLGHGRGGVKSPGAAGRRVPPLFGTSLHRAPQLQRSSGAGKNSSWSFRHGISSTGLGSGNHRRWALRLRHRGVIPFMLLFLGADHPIPPAAGAQEAGEVALHNPNGR